MEKKKTTTIEKINLQLKEKDSVNTESIKIESDTNKKKSLITSIRTNNFTSNEMDPEIEDDIEDEFKEIYNIKIKKSLNNTIVTITDSSFKTVLTTSCGRIGYKKGKRKHSNAYQAIWYTVVNLLKKKTNRYCKHLFFLDNSLCF